MNQIEEIKTNQQKQAESLIKLILDLKVNETKQNRNKRNPVQ